MLSYDNKTTTTGMGGIFTDSVSIGTPIYATSTSSSITISSSFNDLSDYVEEKRKQEKAFKEDCQIKDVIEYVPEKVYKIIFKDKTEVKTICSDDDIFDLAYVFYLAIAKKLYSKTLTFDGVLNKSYEIQYEKQFNKIAKNGMKILKQKQEEKQKEEKEKILKKQQKEKAILKKKIAKERKRREQVNIIADAIRLSKTLK